MEFKPPQELLDFTGKSVVVTGAGVGIGAAIAARFAQAGADVTVHYKTSKDGAQAVAERIEATGKRALVVQADLTRATDVQRLFDQTISIFGKVDVLVNNAGIYPHALVLDMTEEQWDDMLDANLKSCFFCTQAAARDMVKRGEGGAIVNIGSIESFNAAAEHSHYDAAKGGMVMFTQATALELGAHGIRVNLVAPGLINAPDLPKNWPEGLARWLKRVPLGRVGEPEDVADVCLFFASDAARFVSGASLLVDGGVMTCQIY